VPGVEPKSALAARIYTAMDAIVAAEVENTVVVTHGYAATFAIASWIAMPLDSVGYVNFRVAAVPRPMEHADPGAVSCTTRIPGAGFTSTSITNPSPSV